MINNYLDWVKRQRKYCVKNALRHARQSRCAKEEWARGFYKGLSMANDFSGQNFRRLQKDLEELNRRGHGVVDVDFIGDAENHALS